MIFSVGNPDEQHGPALPINNDDYLAKHITKRVLNETNIDYGGHIPYATDGFKYADWSRAVIKSIIFEKKVIEFIKKKMKKAEFIIVLSGHGGNNVLKKNEKMISKELGVPFLYVKPFWNVSLIHEKYGEILVDHADNAEHSLSEYLGIVNHYGLKLIHDLAEKDPKLALEKWKVLAGLGWYVLYGGKKYDYLRKPPHLTVAARFIKDKRIIADPDLGKRLFDLNHRETMKQIDQFLQ